MMGYHQLDGSTSKVITLVNRSIFARINDNRCFSTMNDFLNTPPSKTSPKAAWAIAFASLILLLGMWDNSYSFNWSNNYKAILWYTANDSLEQLYSLSFLITSWESSSMRTFWALKSINMSRPMMSALSSAWLFEEYKSNWNENSMTIPIRDSIILWFCVDAL